MLASLLVAVLLGEALTGVSADARHTIVMAVRNSGEADPVVSITPEAGLPRGPLADSTYIANTRPKQAGAACLSRRYVIVIPAKASAARQMQIYSYASVSFKAECLKAEASGFAQIQPSGLSSAQVQATLARLAMVWSTSAHKQFKCSAMAAAARCPTTPQTLAAIAPLANLRLVQWSATNLKATFWTAGEMVTEITVPQSSGGVVTISQRQVPPL